MKQLSLVLFFIIVCGITTSFSQDIKAKDSIIMTGSVMEGTRFYQHGEKISMGRVTELLKVNPGAYTFLKKSKANNVPALILSIAGGFLVGYELGSLAGGRDIDWGVMGGGLGANGISIPVYIVAKHNAKKAIDLYNSSFR
jgi:hypothetical protein